ncbi:uncharacterized protein LOC144112464 [Amblyomma americanum]
MVAMSRGAWPSPTHAPLLIATIVATTCRARLLGFYQRKGLIPSEVTGLFGLFKPSFGHAKRVCKILRSELWNQVRLLQDLLRAACYAQNQEWLAGIRHRQFMKLAVQTTEVWWKCSINQAIRRMEELRKVKMKAPERQDVLVLGGAEVPEEFASVLKEGPKFSVPAILKPHEWLSLNRRLANRTEQENQERCLLDGIDTITRSQGWKRQASLIPSFLL